MPSELGIPVAAADAIFASSLKNFNADPEANFPKRARAYQGSCLLQPGIVARGRWRPEFRPAAEHAAKCQQILRDASAAILAPFRAREGGAAGIFDLTDLVLQRRRDRDEPPCEIFPIDGPAVPPYRARSLDIQFKRRRPVPAQPFKCVLNRLLRHAAGCGHHPSGRPDKHRYARAQGIRTSKRGVSAANTSTRRLSPRAPEAHEELMLGGQAFGLRLQKKNVCILRPRRTPDAGAIVVAANRPSWPVRNRRSLHEPASAEC